MTAVLHLHKIRCAHKLIYLRSKARYEKELQNEISKHVRLNTVI